jgi:hypothetical protein
VAMPNAFDGRRSRISARPLERLSLVQTEPRAL